jgi:hypothetical protein
LAPAFFNLHPAGVHDFHIRNDCGLRKQLAQLPDGIEPLALDEGSACLKPVNSTGDSGLGVFQSSLQINKIKS